MEHNSDIVKKIRRDVRILSFPHAKQVKEYLSDEGTELLLKHGDHFRVVTNNARYGNTPISDDNIGVAEDIVRFLRNRRTAIPVLVFCHHTLPAAKGTKWPQTTSRNGMNKVSHSHLLFFACLFQ